MFIRIHITILQVNSREITLHAIHVTLCIVHMYIGLLGLMEASRIKSFVSRSIETEAEVNVQRLIFDS